MDPLKLAALDAEDLAVISAHLQDAVLKVGDMTFLPRQKRFALVANRFDWSGSEGARNARRQVGMQVERVLKAQRSRIRSDAPDAVLNLLAVTFEEADPPAGIVTLHFSGGAAIRLEVECLEVAMADLGPAWETQARPRHDTGD